MNILREAIAHYGRDNQLNQAAEELAELIVSINHCRRGRVTADAVASELADAKIMMDQVAIIFNVDPRDHIDEKLDRLKRRIDGLE